MSVPPPPPTAVATDDSVTVRMMSTAEWKAAATEALGRLGLTYDQLADQAAQKNFVSTAARKLWVSIGGTL